MMKLKFCCSSQSRFPVLRVLNSWMVSIGLPHRSDGINVIRWSGQGEEKLGVMWRLAAVGTYIETSVLLYSVFYRSLGVYNIRILTVRGWRVPPWLCLFLSRWLGVENLTLYCSSDLWQPCWLLQCKLSGVLSFILSANIISSTVLRCLVNSVSFIRLLGVSIVVLGLADISRFRTSSQILCR